MRSLRTPRRKEPRTLLGRLYRRRSARLVLWLVLVSLYTLFIAGLHPFEPLAVLFAIPAFALGMWPLRPHHADPISTVVGWLLAGTLTLFFPLAVSTLWLDAFGTVRSGTVVESHYHRGSISTGHTTGRRAHYSYAVRTDDGQRFDTSLTSTDLGRVEVGDRVQLRVDPAGVLGPQGERTRHDVGVEVEVWLGVSAAVGLVALEVVARVRGGPGVFDDEGG